MTTKFTIHVPCKCQCGCKNLCAFGQMLCSFCRQGFHEEKPKIAATEKKEPK